MHQRRHNTNRSRATHQSQQSHNTNRSRARLDRVGLTVSKIIAIIRLHCINYVHYTLYWSCLPIFEITIIWIFVVDDFEETTNNSVVGKSSFTVHDFHNFNKTMAVCIYHVLTQTQPCNRGRTQNLRLTIDNANNNSYNPSVNMTQSESCIETDVSLTQIFQIEKSCGISTN